MKSKEISRSDKKVIVFFNTSRTWGGGEQWHYQTALKLHGLGYQVRVITNTRSELHDRLIKHDIPVKRFPVTNLTFINPLTLIRIARYLRKEGATTVILNLSADAKTGGFAARMAGVRRIIYRRGLAAPVKDTMLNRFLFRRVFTHIIANSEDTREMILHNNPYLVPDEKISVLRNWVDIREQPSGDNNPDMPGIKEKKLVLGNLGRMVEVKRQDLLIRMASSLKKEGINFRLVIGGTGELEDDLKEYAERLGLKNEVEFPGFVHDVKSFMQEIDIFILSSRYEGFGFVLAEAMLEKNPVIAFDTSSIPEMIEHGENGFLVPFGDHEAMVHYVKLLESSPRLLRKMGEKGRKLVYDRYTFDRQLPVLGELLGLDKAV